MSRRPGLRWFAAWLAVGVFWLFATRWHHPTWPLALITTASLISAYAAASYVNQFLLVPGPWRQGRYARYWALLLVVMALLNAAALAVIRVSYHRAVGPDPDPHGTVRHYLIDLFGMVVHVSGAAMVARGARR